MPLLKELPEPNDDNTYRLCVLHDDDSLRIRDRFVETGLAVLVDADNQRVIVPFHDGMTAEEVARIITGTIRRGLDAGPSNVIVRTPYPIQHAVANTDRWVTYPMDDLDKLKARLTEIATRVEVTNDLRSRAEDALLQFIDDAEVRRLFLAALVGTA